MTSEECTSDKESIVLHVKIVESGIVWVDDVRIDGRSLVGHSPGAIVKAGCDLW